MKAIHGLILEYWEWLDFDPRFAGFEEDLKTLPGRYAEPEGCLLLARWDGEPAGCVALRKVESDTCEMKRLYVRPAFRGKAVGSALAARIIEEARHRGYISMRLDTLPVMTVAIGMYERLGFRNIPPYGAAPGGPGARYMELDLKQGRDE